MDPLVPSSENPTQFVRRVMYAYDIVGSFGEAVRLDLPKHHPLEVFLKGIPRKAGEKAQEALQRMPSLLGDILEEMAVAAKAATKFLENDYNNDIKSILGINFKASKEGAKVPEKNNFSKKVQFDSRSLSPKQYHSETSNSFHRTALEPPMAYNSVVHTGLKPSPQDIRKEGQQSQGEQGGRGTHDGTRNHGGRGGYGNRGRGGRGGRGVPKFLPDSSYLKATEAVQNLFCYDCDQVGVKRGHEGCPNWKPRYNSSSTEYPAPPAARHLEPTYHFPKAPSSTSFLSSAPSTARHLQLGSNSAPP
ncbi:MAG: hypothetical protein ACK5PF_04955, partial [bacterium]